MSRDCIQLEMQDPKKISDGNTPDRVFGAGEHMEIDA
jgi:hypothetical protein